jgi:[protein-PII] uridylyltransferase
MLDPTVLYLALLMHDTGRAAEKKTHADVSTILADQVCRRLQIKGERRNQLLLLVDNHLIMFLTATKNDPDDPEVVQNFARIVKNRENLDMLFVMTMADSKGVGGNSWSAHKEALLRELYHNTRRYFDAPSDFMARATVPLDSLKFMVAGDLHRSEKDRSYDKEVDAHFERMPRAYFNFRKHTTIAKHLQQFREFFEQLDSDNDELSLLPVLRWEDKPLEGCSKLVVIGWDRHLLLARVAGALAAESLSIVSADFYQRADHLVLDVFRVSTTNFEPVTGENTRKRVQKAVHDALKTEEFDFSPRIATRRKQAGMAEIEADIPQWVYINNNISPNHTVIELQAIDRIGLLYDVFMVIGKLGFSVTHARIGTERGVAVDAIYVQDVSGQKITDEARFMPLKQSLEKAVIALESKAK